MYRIVEVNDKKSEREFINLPLRLYKDNPYWVRPIDKDIRNKFDPRKNPCFRHGRLVRWILVKEDEVVGRVAAFVNEKTACVGKYRVGQFGFFECIDDRKAAFALFDRCREWLENEGMEAMEGPVNFGERLEWWGLLVDGYDKMPNYNMSYNPEYYVDFFESYGFKDYYKQFTFRTRVMPESLSPMVVWKADRMLKNPDYKVYTYGDIGRRRAIDALLEVYNKAWSLEVHGVSSISREEVVDTYRKIGPIMDKNLIYFAFYKNAPIGFFVMLPELNQAVKRLKGKMNMGGMLKLLYIRYITKINVALGILFGVVPEFQGKGVEATMIKMFSDKMAGGKSCYDYLEMNWIGDFNPPMVHLMRHISATASKTHVTYRKLFDESRTFVRSVDENLEKA